MKMNTKSKPFLRGQGPFKLPSSNMTLEAPGWKAGLLPFPHGLFGAQALCDLEFIQRMGKVLHPFPQRTNHRTFAHFLISPINVLSYPISVKLQRTSIIGIPKESVELMPLMNHLW